MKPSGLINLATLSEEDFPDLVTISDGIVTITKANGTKNTYDFEVKRINSYHALIQWILHLSGKCWFTGEHCNDLIECVCEHFGWDPHTPDH